MSFDGLAAMVSDDFFVNLFKGGLFQCSCAGGLSTKNSSFCSCPARNHHGDENMHRKLLLASGGSVPIRKRWLGEKSPAH
jgi:hypothetical protein